MSSTTLKIGFSPCPNDTFIFDALVNGKIDTGNLVFEPFMADVEELNRRAFAHDLPITKLSYHALGYLSPHYQLLRSGSALGNNCGPLLIAKQAMDRQSIAQARIAIPGKYTTANFLLRIAYPEVQHTCEMLFSDIEEAVLNGTVDAGLIIHENRFTYTEKGLVKLCDLGEFWENSTQMPIPLGGIAIQRHLPDALKQQVENLLQQSVAYAFAHRAETMPFVRQHAQTMHDEVMKQHIDLYVNHYTLNLGEKGEQAVRILYEKAESIGLFNLYQPLFIDR
jgi:1,4-dihydroxy-6-naphthoate synthase